MNVAICAGASIPQKDKVHCNINLPPARAVAGAGLRPRHGGPGTAGAARQARETHGNLMLQHGFMLIVACCVLLVLVIAAVVADAKFGGGDEPKAAIMEGLPSWL